MAELEKYNKDLMTMFENINFNRKTINRIVIKFKNLVGRSAVLRKRVKEAVEKTFSKDVDHLISRYKTAETTEQEMAKIVKETGGLSFNNIRTFYLNASDAHVRLQRLNSETEM